ncbi:Na(+)-dependent transporter [Shewanella sp. OPT22]|nr:Na(+)-dependent transporter [Shewanella sp. OPT22]
MIDFTSMLQIFLPLALALMMFVLGMNVTVEDFKSVQQQPKAFFLGVSLQLLLLPALAWCVILVANLFIEVPLLISIGLILLAACPGGATSNVISQLSGGNSALSLSMTAFVSLVLPFILPSLFIFQASLLGSQVDRFSIPILPTTAKLLLVTVIPVFLGMTTRYISSEFCDRYKNSAEAISSWLFVVIVCLLISNNFAKLIEVGALMAVLCLSLCVLATAMTFYISKKANLDRRETKTLQIEVGIQNAAMGIFIANDLLNWSELALISLCYGVLMNIPAFYFVLRYKKSN